MIPPKQVTLRDIASYTGYSTMLVSTAITGRGRISDETKAEIQAAAMKLGYVPDAAARSLRGRPRNNKKRPLKFIALVIDQESPSLRPWLTAIQGLDMVAVVFHKDKTFSKQLLAACRPTGSVWFGQPPKGLPFPSVRGIGENVLALMDLF